MESHLFENTEVLTMDHITTYANRVNETGIRHQQVKKLFLQKFGTSVTFVWQRLHSKSELVYASDCASEIIARVMHERGDSDDAAEGVGLAGYDSDGEEGGDDDDDDGGGSDDDGRGCSAKALHADKILLDQDSCCMVYHAARILRRMCQKHGEHGKCKGLSVNDANAAIPDLLFNFLV